MPVIIEGAALDVHTHIASQFLTDLLSGGGLPSGGSDDLLARLDEANVRDAIILSAGYFGKGAGLTGGSHMAPENDFVAAEIAKFPDRLIGFCRIESRSSRTQLARWTGALPYPG